MKKIVSILLLPVLGAGIFEAHAFDRNDYYKYPNDVSIQYSLGSTQTFASLVIGSYLVIPATITGMNFDRYGSTGTIGAGYMRSLGKTVSVGLVFNYTRQFTNYHDKDNPAITGHFSIDWYFLMATARFYWFKTPGFAMYSKIGLGSGMYGTQSKQKAEDGKLDKSPYSIGLAPALQLSPVSMEFGGRLRGFIELGAGMEGIALGGLKYYF